MKIKVTKEVRALLVELDQAMQEFHALTGQLADRSLSNSVAVNLGADRESVKSRLIGIAYRLHKASAPFRYKCNS